MTIMREFRAARKLTEAIRLAMGEHWDNKSKTCVGNVVALVKKCDEQQKLLDSWGIQQEKTMAGRPSKSKATPKSTTRQKPKQKKTPKKS